MYTERERYIMFSCYGFRVKRFRSASYAEEMQPSL